VAQAVAGHVTPEMCDLLGKAGKITLTLGSFEVQTYLYLSGPVLITNNELNISELDNDKAS
jgi:hypothetical protein